MTTVLEPPAPTSGPTRPARAEAPRGFKLGRDTKSYFRKGMDLKDLKASPYGLTPLLLFVAMALVSDLAGPFLYVASRDIIREFDVTISTLAATTATVGTVMAIVSLGIGYLADRHRRVPMLAIGYFADGALGAMTAFSQSYTQVNLFGAGRGIAGRFGGTPAGSLMSDYYPVELRGRVGAFSGIVDVFPTLLGPVLAGLAVGALGWRSAYVVCFLPICVFAIIAFIKLKEPVRGYWERKFQGADDEVAEQEDIPPSFGEAWRSVMAVRTLRRQLMAGIPSSIAAGAAGIVSFILYFNVYNLDVFTLGLMAIPPAIAGLFAAIIGAGIADTLVKTHPARIITISYSLSLLGPLSMLVLSTIPPLWVLVTFNTVLAFGAGIPGPAAGAVRSQIVPPTVRTQGYAMLGLGSLPGLIFGAPLGAALANSVGPAQAYLFLAPLATVGAFISISAAGFFEGDRRNALRSTMTKQEHFHAMVDGTAKQLSCRGVDVDYNGVQVLFDVDFDADAGEIVALLGTNGAGKSTLLRAICGQQQATAGTVIFEGRQITRMPPHEVAGVGITMMPGGRGVFPTLSVRENLLLGSWMSADPARDRETLDEVYALFPAIAARLDTPAGQLSGGEQQQVSLAQAMLTRPKVLMIDELSLGLAPAVVGQLIDVVKGIAATGVTIIVVEQSVNVALTLADRAVYMEKGTVRFDGPVSELQRRPDILRAVHVTGASGFTDVTARATSARREQQLASATPILEVTSLSKSFGGVRAVDDVSFTLRDGEVLGLIGPNGAGKTTLFELISGHQVADSGSVLLKGVDVTKWSPEKRASAGLIRRFQDARLFPSLTVYETLLVALEGKLDVHSSVLHASGAPGARRAERRIRQRADRLVELLELGSYRDKFVRELSTGLRRIVDIACSLALEPELLLLDEPSTGVAQAEAEGLAPLLRQVQFETGCSILIIEHDMPLISAVSDELLALVLGRTVVRGTPDVVLADEQVVSAYLGNAEEAIKRSGSIH